MFEPKKDKSQEVQSREQSFSSGVIFGAANGIGRAIGELLLAQKIPLLLSIDRDPSFSGHEVTDPESGSHQIKSDITDMEQLQRALQGIRPASLDLAVFSAGIQNDSNPALTYAVNVEGIQNCFAVVAPLLKRGALTVFLSSDLITFPTTGGDQPYSPYVESKRAVAKFATAVSQAYPDLRVLILLPGPVKTKLFLEGKSEELLSTIEAEVGILSSTEFTRMVFQDVIPQFVSKPSGSAVRMYKKSGIEWLPSLAGTPLS